MCFSADASFLAAAVTGVAGAVALSRTTRRAEWMLAAMPLFFAGQQAIEGMLWQALTSGADASSWTQLFLLLALVFWPVYAPLSAYLIEPDAKRRQWMALPLACGAIVAGYFLWSLNAAPQIASIGSGHIVYSGDPDMPGIFRLMYPVAVCGAAAVSTHRAIRLLALILIAGSLVAYAAYWHAFASVWCFFAAAASVVIVFQFEYARRMRKAESL
ncbi:MAG: hypothetical protein HOP09_13215 [Hyphomicrobium sp.]|nr:hypothetical protein [Hyphomicrobium sp.]